MWKKLWISKTGSFGSKIIATFSFSIIKVDKSLQIVFSWNTSVLFTIRGDAMQLLIITTHAVTSSGTAHLPCAHFPAKRYIDFPILYKQHNFRMKLLYWNHVNGMVTERIGQQFQHWSIQELKHKIWFSEKPTMLYCSSSRETELIFLSWPYREITSWYIIELRSWLPLTSQLRSVSNLMRPYLGKYGFSVWEHVTWAYLTFSRSIKVASSKFPIISLKSSRACLLV